MIKLDLLVFHHFMLHLDMPVQGVLRAITLFTITIGTKQPFHYILVTSSLHFLCLLGLSPLNASNLLEELEHHLVLLFSLIDLLQQGLFSPG